MKELPTNSTKCMLCGSNLNITKPYLGVGGETLIRDFAYLLPTWVLRIITSPNATLREKANSVIVNKTTFGEKKLFWCRLLLHRDGLAPVRRRPIEQLLRRFLLEFTRAA